MLTRMYVELDTLKESLKERVYETLRRLREREDGVALVEYALLITGIVLAASGAVLLLYQAISNRVTNATSIIGGAGSGF